MKILTTAALTALWLATGVLTTGLRAESGRIYGTILTQDGETLEGWIRWDKNEAFWDDVIDGTKEKEGRSRKKRSRDRSENKWFNFNFDGSGIISGSARQTEIKLGHIESIIPVSSGEATVVLKSGKEFDITGADIGSAVREILILDKTEGEIYLDWDDIDEITFKSETSEPQDGAERLFGKVTTRAGEEFVGWIEWDVDEVLSTDELDGDEDKRRNRKVEFGKIKSIERRSRSSAIVNLTNGKTMRLSGTNDVNSENRGIRVKSSDVSRIDIPWSEFDVVVFMPVPKDRIEGYSAFDGGQELHGTVYDEDGKQYTGKIVWDDDERYTWEHLNGKYDDLDVIVEFSSIKSIERDSHDAAIVTTRGGRNLVLSGSNDVDSDNNGIIVLQPDGDQVELDWYDFSKVEFK
jgi:hypothetical protein